MPGKTNVVPDSFSRRPDHLAAAMVTSGGVSTDFMDEIRAA